MHFLNLFLDKMLDKLEVPQLAEAHEVVYHVV